MWVELQRVLCSPDSGMCDKTRDQALIVQAKVAKLLDLIAGPADEQGILQRFRRLLLPRTTFCVVRVSFCDKPIVRFI